MAGYLSCPTGGDGQEKAAPESAAQFHVMPPREYQAESPPAAAGAGVADESLPEEALSLDFEVSDDLPSLEDEDDSVEDSLLSEASDGRLGRP